MLIYWISLLMINYWIAIRPIRVKECRLDSKKRN